MNANLVLLLQCVAVSCSELQCVAVSCSVLQCLERVTVFSVWGGLGLYGAV